MSSTQTPASSFGLCVIDKCELVSLALCQCCKQDLCIDHLNEHAQQRNKNLLPLMDRINLLTARFEEFVQSEKSPVKQLKIWREQAYKVVNEFYEKKSRELTDHVFERNRIQIDQIQESITALLRKKGGAQQDIERLSRSLDEIEEFLQKTPHLTVELPALVVDDTCILRPSIQNGEINHDNVKGDVISGIESVVPSNEVKLKKSKRNDKTSKKRRKSSRSSDRNSRYESSRSRSRSSQRSTKYKYKSKSSQSQTETCSTH